MVNGMMGFGSGMMGGYGITGLILEIIIILVVVLVVIALLNRTNYVAGGSEQLARIEKDLEDVKKTVEEIKNKLNEI